MKLIRIDTQKPIAVMHVLSRDVKHVTTKACLRKINWLFANRHNPFVAESKVLHDFPCIIDTARIENVNRIRPLQHAIETLTNNVGFVANRQKRVIFHAAAGALSNRRDADVTDCCASFIQA